jgi:NAD(P)-dependent dehydrogenase (short-subunit alcohol dehydrogenase family)
MTTRIDAGVPRNASPNTAVRSAKRIVVPAQALPLGIEDLPGRSGLLATGEQHVEHAFPGAVTLLGASRVRALSYFSTIVGMICPGLHSIFSAFHVDVVDESATTQGLSFLVNSVDERFRMVKISVAGDGLIGSITAFARQPPIAQPTLRDIAPFVSAAEFAGTTALVVGGSRGLGAITARAVAAGGGRVILTYATGESDARRVAAEIDPERCRVMRYDALDSAGAQLSQLEWHPNHIYYFATAQIFRQKATWFVASRFEEFCKIYVTGFADLCSAIRTRREQAVSVFYPSSIAVEEHPREMTEYSLAKAAGEMLCTDMNRFLPKVHVVVHRLPRMLTDQTATVLPVQSHDAVEVMLPIIRQMHAAGSS